jgi:hypothetical protein
VDSVELAVLFDDIVSEFIGVVRSDTGTVGIMFIVSWTPRFIAAFAQREIGSAHDWDALHCSAIAFAMPA